jgi:hypothetical protein
VEHLLIRKPEYGIALDNEVRRALLVILGLIRVNRAVYLDDQVSLNAAEIRDEAANRVLPAKARAQLTVAQLLPEQLLCGRLIAPQLTRPLAVRSIHTSPRIFLLQSRASTLRSLKAAAAANEDHRQPSNRVPPRPPQRERGTGGEGLLSIQKPETYVERGEQMTRNDLLMFLLNGT